MHEKVTFVACDNPYAKKLTIHILAAFAEHEAETISARTVEALAALKRRGVKLGSPTPSIGAQAAGAAVAADADAFAAKMLPIILALRRQGLDTYRSMAQALTDAGIPLRAAGAGTRLRCGTFSSGMTLAAAREMPVTCRREVQYAAYMERIERRRDRRLHTGRPSGGVDRRPALG